MTLGHQGMSRDFPEEMRTGWQRVNSLRTGESWAPGEEPGGRVGVGVQKMVSEPVVSTDADTQVQLEGQMGGSRSQRQAQTLSLSQGGDTDKFEAGGVCLAQTWDLDV